MKKNIFIALLFLFIAQNAFSETLTMNEAVSLGIVQNKQLKTERAKIGISDAEIKQAGLRINPKLVLEASLADNSYLGGIQQTFELGGKRKKRILSAKADKEALIEQISNEIIKIRSEIKNAYIDLYIAKEQYKTSNEIFEITNELAKITNKQEKAGQVAMLDVLQTETANIKAKNNIQIAQNEYNRAFNTLNNLIGNTLQYDIEIQKPIMETDFIEFKNIQNKENQEETMQLLIDTGIANNHLLKALEKNLEKTKHMEKLARSTAIPDIAILAGPQVNVFKEEKTKSNVNLYTTIEMILPIHNYGQAAVMNAKAQKDVLLKQIEAKKTEIELEVRNTYLEVLQNQKSVQVYENEILPKTSEILKKSEISFQEGKSSILTPLNAQQVFIESKFGYMKTLSYYYKSLINLEKVIGVDNEDI